MSGRKILRIIFSICGALIIGAGLYYGYMIFMPNIDTDGKEEFLYLPTGSDAEDVAVILSEMKVLKNPSTFLWLAERKNYKGSNIVPGKYALKDGSSNNVLINNLRAGNGRLEVVVQFNQIQTKAELAGRLSQNIEPDSVQILNWLNNPDSIALYGFNSHTIMSMFIPNTYRMDWAVSVNNLMNRMAGEYKKFWNNDRKAKAREIGLSQSEVTTLASIVYWETKKAEDMPRIAGVYMNRLKINMPLQADPTLIFAIGDFSIKRVLNKHKMIDSPYNTYKYSGLPPGPIIIPPISYIDAVLNYEQNDYLYFVAKEDLSGESYFSKTYQQHLIYARRYQKTLNDLKVYQ